MAGLSYEDWQSGVLAPTWLRRTTGSALQRVLGAIKDLVAGASKEAVKARIVAEAATDALSYIGSDRNIERYPNEATASYRARLARAWTVWEFAGTAAGIIEIGRAHV